MRRFEVYIDKGIPGVEPDTEVIEFPDDATEEDIREACSDCLETMIGNCLDTGWNEIEAKPRRVRATETATNEGEKR